MKIGSIPYEFSKEDIFIYVLLCPAIFLYVLFDRFPLIYAVPFVYVVYRISTDSDFSQQIRNIRESDYFRLILSVIVLGLISLCFHDLHFDDKVWIRDVVIIVASLIPFIVANTFTDKHVKAIFITQAVSYFLWIDYSSLFTFSSSVKRLRWSTEYDLGLFFGLFVLYFFLTKSYRWFLVSLIIALLISKRVVFIGFGFCGVLYLFNLIISQKRSNRTDQIILFSSFILLGIVSLNLVDIISFFVAKAGKNPVMTNKFLNGRADVFNFSTFKILHANALQFFLGHGPGQLDASVTLFRPVPWAQYSAKPTNPHNDFLKILFDYGVLGFLTFGYFLSKIYSSNKMGVYLLGFTLVLFLVDNSFLHVYYNLIAYIILSVKQIESNKDAQ